MAHVSPLAGVRKLRAGFAPVLAGALLAICSTFTPAPAATLLNGGFETPDIGTGSTFSFVTPSRVEGWDTTDSHIEIWANGFKGVTSFEGTQHAEINAKRFGTLFQTVTGIVAGADLVLEFAHRARKGTDTMRVEIVDLGADDRAGTADDTTLFSRVFSATTEAWIFSRSSSFSEVTALGGDVQVAFTAVSTGSGSVSVGNFLDAVRLHGDVPAVPLPVPALLLIAGLYMLVRIRRA